MDDSTNPRARAIAALAEMFLDLAFGPEDFAAIESKAIDLGHGCMVEALGLALEAYDARLMGGRPRHRDRRRLLLHQALPGPVRLRRLPAGGRARHPLRREGLAGRGRLPDRGPGARLLRQGRPAARPARLARAGDDRDALHAGRRIALRRGGQVGGGIAVRGRGGPGGGAVRRGDLHGGRRHLVQPAAPRRGRPEARRGEGGLRLPGQRGRGKKVVRRNAVHHACIASPDEVWSEAVPAIGRRFDLAKIKRVHLGADGEAWCSAAPRFIPVAEVTFHLGPFHVNRAGLSCFAEPEMAWNVIDCIADGDKGPAIALPKACLGLGLAREKRARSVISYLEGNADAIAVDGPSLGTMESENQHLYGVRMDSFPCAWSLRGASDMARIVSRRACGREVPRMTRERSMGARRAWLRESKELPFCERGGSAGTIPQTAGSGYLPPHQADTGRMDAGKAYALRKGMANLDRRI